MKLFCQWCNTEFEASRKDAKYCSRSCQEKSARARRAQGISSTEKICNKCGKTFQVKQNAWSRRYCYDCIPEISTSGAKNRQIIKKWALEYKGGKCEICGYHKCSDALEFHHEDPTQKEFSLSDRNLILDWQVIKLELDKCKLVCANCHREAHSEEMKNES